MAVGLAFSFTLQTHSACYQASTCNRSTMPIVAEQSGSTAVVASAWSVRRS